MESLCNAEHVSLESNYRNSENVVNTSDAIGWKRSYTTKNYLVPCKNIVGPTNFYYKNLQFDNASLAIAAIKKYFSSDLNDPVVILLEDPDQSCIWLMLGKSSLHHTQKDSEFFLLH